MNRKRKIYDQDYYQIQLIISNPKFKKEVKRLTDLFARFGCPIPKEGFKSYKEYLAWNDNYFTVFARVEQSQEFKEKIMRITGGKNRWCEDEQIKIEELREKDLPPVYGHDIDMLLEKFGIDRKHKNQKNFHDFIVEYIFFKRTEYSNAPAMITWKRNEKTEKMELFIRILPHTRKEDIINAWPIIKEEQQRMSDYKKRHKQYKNFHRDLEIYNLYKHLQNNKTPQKNKGKNIYFNKRADQEVCSIIQGKYGKDLSWEAIRKIVSEMDKFVKSCEG